jgi:hypothetical protein
MSAKESVFAVLVNNHGAGSAVVQSVRRTPALSVIGSRCVVAGASRNFQESGLRVAPLDLMEEIAMQHIRTWAGRAASVLPYAIAGATIISILLFAL